MSSNDNRTGDMLSPYYIREYKLRPLDPTLEPPAVSSRASSVKALKCTYRSWSPSTLVSRIARSVSQGEGRRRPTRRGSQDRVRTLGADSDSADPFGDDPGADAGAIAYLQHRFRNRRRLVGSGGDSDGGEPEPASPLARVQSGSRDLFSRLSGLTGSLNLSRTGSLRRSGSISGPQRRAAAEYRSGSTSPVLTRGHRSLSVSSPGPMNAEGTTLPTLNDPGTGASASAGAALVMSDEDQKEIRRFVFGPPLHPEDMDVGGSSYSRSARRDKYDYPDDVSNHDDTSASTYGIQERPNYEDQDKLDLDAEDEVKGAIEAEPASNHYGFQQSMFDPFKYQISNDSDSGSESDIPPVTPPKSIRRAQYHTHEYGHGGLSTRPSSRSPSSGHGRHVPPHRRGDGPGGAEIDSARLDLDFHGADLKEGDEVFERWSGVEEGMDVDVEEEEGEEQEEEQEHGEEEDDRDEDDEGDRNHDGEEDGDDKV